MYYGVVGNNRITYETGEIVMDLGQPLRIIEVVPEPKPMELPGKAPAEPSPQEQPEKVGA
jgi:hypothetical protein